ncbi:CHRD domain-containing protein [Pontibacter populi]|uniref:CHRD domain-containing protein n=1 Tax=Pontibacter populi TaxID=890055 RepID=A0ABV1RYE4_9BACT
MLAICIPLLALTAACDDDDDDVIPPPVEEPDLEFVDIELLGANERPTPVETTGSGSLDAEYDDDTNILSYTVTWTLGNAEDETVAMHFHGPAGPDESAPPVITIDHGDGDYVGSVTAETDPLTAAQEADLKAGLWYINIHSTTYSNGELRGQLIAED